MNITQFKQLPIRSELLKNLDLIGFKNLTDIQAAAIPVILENQDLIGQAQTGSGKTIAYALPILNKIDVSQLQIQAVILCPTRELAAQVTIEMRRLGRLVHNLKVLTLCGGATFGPQVASLSHGAHVVVGTPGRVLDHLHRKTLRFSGVKTLVLDEADRMLDMGFGDDIRSIVSFTPNTRQTLLFSATFPDNIQSMSQDIQRQAVRVEAASSLLNQDINQIFYETTPEKKLDTLLALYAKYKPESSIVFCTTKIQCREVARFLSSRGLVALEIHSDLDQDTRNEVMVRFGNGSISILVATDVAARGLDIQDLSAVINFDISRDPEIHVHRIGRTGRAGKTGLALSLYSRSEQYRLDAIATYSGETLQKKPQLSPAQKFSLKPPMATLKIWGGKKNKLRPGDVLGALTQDARVESKFIGKIAVFDSNTYVGIVPSQSPVSGSRIAELRIKNRVFKMEIMI